MRYAIVTGGAVTNVIALREINAGDFPGAVALHDRPVGIGDTYSESKFGRDGEELLTSDEKIAAMQTAISMTVAWGPAGLSCSPTGCPSPAHAVSQRVISLGSGMSEVARPKSSATEASLKPNFSAYDTRFLAPSSSAICAKAVLAESAVASVTVTRPYEWPL